MQKEIEDFIKEINTLRLKKKNQGGWYYFRGNISGKEIEIKGYSTWLQRYIIDGVSWDGEMDISVKKFKATLLEPFI